MIHFTADHHFFHHNIIEYCQRPFKSLDHMHKVLITNYNSVVEEEDDVFFVGDLALKGPDSKGQVENIVNRLGGKKHLILGNHDRLKPSDYLEMGFWSVHTSSMLYPLEKTRGLFLYLSHDPVCLPPKDHYIICGHVHNFFKMYKNVINVGIDMWNFTPVSEKQLFDLIHENDI